MQADNRGIWLLHCHIFWHQVSSWLAAQFLLFYHALIYHSRMNALLVHLQCRLRHRCIW